MKPEIDDRDMVASARKVWHRLDRCHRGAERAVTQAALARDLAMDARTLQAAIARLVIEHKKPIASSCRPPLGVFVAETAEEKAGHAQQLEHRIISLAKRLRAFTKAPRVLVERQSELWDGGTAL